MTAVCGALLERRIHSTSIESCHDCPNGLRFAPVQYRDRIITDLANSECDRLCRRAIRHLQMSKDYLQTGDDTCLGSTRDEICVDVQVQESLAWDVYEVTIRATIRHDIESLAIHAARAIWLQTNQGSDWYVYNDNDEEETDVPICDDDIEDYLLNEYLLVAAGRWSNSRIRKYCERYW